MSMRIAAITTAPDSTVGAFFALSWAPEVLYRHHHLRRGRRSWFRERIKTLENIISHISLMRTEHVFYFGARGPANHQIINPKMGKITTRKIHNTLVPIVRLLPKMLTIAQISAIKANKTKTPRNSNMLPPLTAELRFRVYQIRVQCGYLME